MLDFMPKEVVDEYGQVEDSMHNGEFLKLDPTKADEIIARLRICGFAVEEDRITVNKAQGILNSA
jgi:hypothetical protein